jgi:hypothetical protein
MKPLDDSWFKAVSEATGKTEDEVFSIIQSAWNEGLTLAEVNARLQSLAQANGKQLILVNSTNN